MTPSQYKALEKRVDRLKDQNKSLRKQLSALRKENKSLLKAEEDSRTLLKDIPGAVVLIQQGKIVFINETAQNQLGYSVEEMLGRNFFDFLHPDSVEYVRTLHERRISGKPVPDEYETYLVTKNGDALCCEFRVKKIKYKGRTAFLFDIMALDERKQKERRLIQVQKMEALVCMASGLGKRFSRLLGLLDEPGLALRDRESTKDIALTRSLRKVDAARELGNFITQQLHCLSSMENNKSDIARLDLKKIVQDVAAMTRPKWKGGSEGHGGKISVKTYIRNISPVEGSLTEIQDAILSIMLNAIEALPDGGVIYLTTEENAGSAYIYIQDNGAGIPNEIKDKIFDPFFTTKGASRAGLGLSLTYAIINRHGGEIEVMSQEEQGATFIVRLPLAPKKTPSTMARRNKKKIRDSKILIISDEDMVKNLLSQVFVSKGSKVTAVSTGTECLKLLRKKKFDLVIADWNEPSMDYPKIIPKIKKTGAGLPVVLINAEGKEKPSETFRKMGVDLTIGRPLDMNRALSLVAKLLATTETSG